MKKSRLVPIDEIDFEDEKYRFRETVNEEEQRKLADNISHYGLQNPVKLKKCLDGKFQVIAGWRRILAIKSLGQPYVDAIVFEDISDKDALEINVLDNAHRKDLNDFERASQARFLRFDRGYEIPEIADLLGVGKQHVYDLLILARMDLPIQQLAIDGKLSLYHVVELSKLPEEMVLSFAERAVEEEWSVKQLKLERRRVTARIVGDPDKMVFDAVRVIKTPEVLNYFKIRSPLMTRVPAPFMCEYSSSIPASKMDPPYVCHNEIEWAVLAPPRYYYRNEEYQGRDVPFDKRDAWAFVCEECAVKLFERIRFHDDEDYFSGMEQFQPDPSE